MGFGSTSPTPVYEDSTALIEWTNNVIDGSERAKHIGITTAFVSILRTKRHSSDIFVSRECPPLISSPMCITCSPLNHQEPPVGTVRYNHRSSSPADEAVIARDVGSREGKRDSRRKSKSPRRTLRGVFRSDGNSRFECSTEYY